MTIENIEWTTGGPFQDGTRALYIGGRLKAFLHYNWEETGVFRIRTRGDFESIPLPMEDIADVEDAKRFVETYVVLTS